MSMLYVAVASIAAVVLGIALLERTIARTSVGVGVVLGYFLLEVSELAPEPTAFGSINVGLTDLTAVLIMTAAIARLLRTRVEPPQQVILALCAIGLYALTRGVLAFGPELAVNEARSWLLFLGTVVYCSAARDDAASSSTIVRQLRWTGSIVAVIACIRWGAMISGVSLGPLTPPEVDGLRVMPSDGAFVTAQAFLLTTPAWLQRADRSLYAISALLLGVTVLLQHRTVWVALIVTLAVLVWRDRDLGRRLTTLLVVAAFAVAALAITVLGSDSDELTERATNSQTLQWRIAGWVDLLVENGPTTPSDTIIGLPFGSGWERQVDDLAREERPHSQYIETFLRFGGLGLLLLVGLYVTLTRRLLQTPGRLRITPFGGRLAAYLLILQMVFAITYVPPESGAIVFGLAVASLRHGRRGDEPDVAERSTAPTPPTSRYASIPGAPLRSAVRR